MDCNVVECDMAERDGEGVVCACEGGSLDVLKEVQRAYEVRLDVITRDGGPNKLQKQVHLLQCWVSDLVEQNALLARTVEQLEHEATSQLLLERRRHAEREGEARAEAAALRRRLARKDGDLRGLLEVLRRLRDPSCALANIHFNEVTQSDIFGPDLWYENQLEQGDVTHNTKHNDLEKITLRDVNEMTCDKVNELKILNDALQKEIETKDREMRRLNQSLEQCEQTTVSLKKEISLSKYHTPDVSKLDAEVTADICCPGLQVGEVEPVKDYTALLRDETAKYQERLEQIEEKVKSSSERVRALREANVALAAEAQTLRQLCVALAEQGRLATMRAQFADRLVREMRRQIIQAKAKLKLYEESCLKVSHDTASGLEVDRNQRNQCNPCNTCNSSMSAGEPCVRQQPRRSLRRRPPAQPERWGSRGPMITSTPNTSHELCHVKLNRGSDVVAVDRSSSPPIVLSDSSANSLQQGFSRNDKADPFHVDFKQPNSVAADENLEVKPRCQSRACNVNLNESIGSSSLACSAGSEARSRSLESKLTATLQVLKNKEETVRVQAESLALAEARIAALSARPPRGWAHRTDRTRPLHSTRSSADGCCVETSEVTAQTQGADDGTVSTLRDNLSIVQRLYRECFYETAKREELIELLRESCLDARSAERRQSARAHRLRAALGSCQDIAVEVENLKTEISNFLNGSNHDSGMWERTEEPLAAEVADELHHIAGQLLQLKELLNDGCSCGLEDENSRLKRINEELEIKLGELRHRVCELEAVVQDKENTSEHHQYQVQLKDQEIISLQKQVAALEADTKEHRTTCADLHLQVQQLQVLLQDRSEELSRAQQQCDQHAATVGQLRLELARAERGAEENEKVRAEVSKLSTAVSEWREQLADSRRRLRTLDEELQRERRHCRHIELHFQEKSRQAAELQEQLEEARTRGAALCEEAQRAVCGVRRCLRRARRTHREQEQKIEEQDKLIKVLQQQQQSDIEQSSSEPCCSRQARARGSGRAGASDNASCSRCPSLTRDVYTSVSEMSTLSAPTPPRRLRKKPLCNDRECQWPAMRAAGSQRPARADAAALADRLHGEMSPADELLERVDRTHEALAEARRRWRLGTSFADLRRGT